MRYITSLIRILNKHRLLILFLVGYLILTTYLSKDIGIPWDETDVYNRGAFLRRYWLGQETYATYLSDVWGVWYDNVYAAIVDWLNFRHTYGGYHALNMLFASIAYISSYGLLWSVYRRPQSAIWGPILLFFTPRFLGDSPINPKDIPMAVLYLTSLWGIVASKNWKTELRILLIGLLIGATAATRIVGLSLLPLVIIFDAVYKKKIDMVTYILISIISFMILLITWPYLGSNFWLHLKEIIAASSLYAWNGEVLFQGRMINATNLPSYYIPWWIAISTPLYILLLSGFAIWRWKQLCKNPAYIMIICGLLITLLIYFSLKPVVYDGLRHFLYILPLVSTLAAFGLNELLLIDKSKIRTFTILLVTILFVKSSWDIHKLYPNYYIYFNEFVGGLKGATGNYETDYFGTTYKEAAIWLKNNLPNDDKIYAIKTCGQTISSTHYFSPRMKWVAELKEADYLICYTRFNEHLQLPDESTIYIVMRDGVELNYVKKNPNR